MKNRYFAGLLALMVHTGLAMGASSSTDPQPGSFPGFATDSNWQEFVEFTVRRNSSGRSIEGLQISVPTEDIPVLRDLELNLLKPYLDGASTGAVSGIPEYRPWSKWQYTGFVGASAVSAACLSSLFTKLTKHYGLNVAPMHIYGGLGAFAAMCSLWGLYRFRTIIPDDTCTGEMLNAAFDMQVVQAAVMGFLQRPNTSAPEPYEIPVVEDTRSIYTLNATQVHQYRGNIWTKTGFDMANPPLFMQAIVRAQCNERERVQGFKWMSCGAAAAIPLLSMAAKEYSAQRLLLK